MDELVFFLGLGIAALAVLACGPVAFALTIAQRRRISILEDRLARFERATPPTAATIPAARPEIAGLHRVAHQQGRTEDEGDAADPDRPAGAETL
ncbi:hypothetical protein, partial [Methylobacterium sp. WL9]|uniref:hypothetical protein n=1 Tax=Methylobacterium sp. WL9 TaxID=2603898 RepID=UPI001FEDAD95